MENTGARALPGILANLKERYDQEKLVEAVRLVIKLFENIVNNPTEEKYRSVKKSNVTLQSKVFCFSGIERIFTELGFTQDGEFYRIGNQSIMPIRDAVIILRAQEVSLQTRRVENEAANKRIAELQAERNHQEEHKKKLLEQMKQDRAEKKQFLKDHPVTDSKANKLNFGSKLITQQELNPNCNQPSG